HGIISTAWGGDCEFVEISAKFGKNIDELLETVLLVAEMEELKADPTVRAIGTVIEAQTELVEEVVEDSVASAMVDEAIEEAVTSAIVDETVEVEDTTKSDLLSDDDTE
ncbi:MAG: hypothetical protein H9W80_13150, partial [Enterococcus sp.]|nr:hypothetical protein [Enterococcus sp.]